MAEIAPEDAPAAPAVSDQTDTESFVTDADNAHTAAIPHDLVPEPLAAVTDAPVLPPAETEPVALRVPLGLDVAEMADLGPGRPAATEEASDVKFAVEARVEFAAVITAAEVPNAAEFAAAANGPIADLLAALPPRAIARDKTGPATVEVAELFADLPSPPPVPVASEKTEPATLEVADVLAGLPVPLPVEEQGSKDDEEELVAAAAAPPPPLPRRKPAAPPEPKVAVAAPAIEPTPQPKLPTEAAPPREKPAPREVPKQQTAIQSNGPLGIWKPMALAPADEPSVSLSKPATARPSGKAYAGQVWAKLARHKPRAGQRGAASVSFAIGANGTLGAVRIARSSGNARIDQLALQTVRSAAPFPRPPSGSASYTIRIDF